MKPLIQFPCPAILCVSFLVSCGVKSPSGFLSDFDQLDAGYGTTDAMASYVAGDVDLRTYHAMIIDPVTTVIADPEISPEVAEQLAAYTQEALRTEFGRLIPLTEKPGTGVLRLRAGLSDVISGTQIQGKPFVSRHASPVVRDSGKIGDATVAAFVSKVSFEGELIDSTSGRRIAALVDHRMGNKRDATAETSWAAIRSGAGMGAKKLAARFKNARE